MRRLDRKARRLRAAAEQGWWTRTGSYTPAQYAAVASAMTGFWSQSLPNGIALLSALGAHRIAHLLRETAASLRQRTTEATFREKERMIHAWYAVRHQFASTLNPGLRPSDEYPPAAQAVMAGIECIWLTSVYRRRRRNVLANDDESMHQQRLRRAREFLDEMKCVTLDDLHTGFMSKRGDLLIVSPLHYCAVRYLPRYEPARQYAHRRGHDVIDAVEVLPSHGEERAMIVVTRPAKGHNLQAHRITLPRPGVNWRVGDEVFAVRRGYGLLPEEVDAWHSRKTSLPSALKHGGHSWNGSTRD